MSSPYDNFAPSNSYGGDYGAAYGYGYPYGATYGTGYGYYGPQSYYGGYGY